MSEQAYLFNYNKWVGEKTKRPKSSDDCYTPPKVYDAVKNWVIKEYHLENNNIVRPFFPDSDYKDYDYKENDVVIDNPPFSILKAIVDFYNAENIKYWLFAPFLTNFSNKCCHVPNNARIDYIVEKKLADGSIKKDTLQIPTGFYTNLDDREVFTSLPLKKVIDDAMGKKKSKPKRNKVYPACCITATRAGKFLNHGYEFSVGKNEGIKTFALDFQIAENTKAFGHCYLLNDRLTKRCGQIEQAIKEEEQPTEWVLSYREKQTIKYLNHLNTKGA